MTQGERAQHDIRRWRGLIDGMESEVARAAPGVWDAAAAGHVRAAVVSAHATLAAMAQGSAGPATSAPERPRKAFDDGPSQARRAKQGRDALLRLGVCAHLSRWADVPAGPPGHRLRSLLGLLVSLSQCRAEVPPGLAPTPGYAANGKALAFFATGLRQVLAKLAERYDGVGAAFSNLWGSAVPLDGTVLSAQRLSRVWTLAAVAVYADWLYRRVAGSGIDAVRQDLWSYSDKDCPVRFAAPDGMAALPTGDDHLHFDLWAQWVVAQALQSAGLLDAELGVDAVWHALRFHMHDFTGKATHHSDGGGRQHSGLAIGMVYQALLIDHLEFIAVPNAAPVVVGLAPSPANQEATMRPVNAAPAVAALQVPLPACCAGQRLTMRVVWEWCADNQGPNTDGAEVRLATGHSEQAGPGPVLEAVWLAWREGQLRYRAERDRQAGVVSLDGSGLGFVPAAAGCLLADGQLQALGHVDLSPLLATGPLWIDVAARAWQRGRWVDLHLQLLEGFIDGQRLDWLVIDADSWDLLRRDGLDLTALQSGLSDARRSLFAWRCDGVGAFLSLGVVLASR